MKAFVIVRVSSQDQLKGYGPDVQWFDDVLPNAPLLGLEVSEQYKRIIQEPATGWARPLFEGVIREAMSLCRKKEIEAVLFPRQDRESRFIFGSFPLLCEVVKAGLKIFFARERFELDPNNAESTERYLNKVQQSQAYIEIMKANTSRGKRQAAKKGMLQSGGFSHTLGYDYVPRVDAKTPPKRLINESEAETVRKIFNWVVNDHLSGLKIVTKLEAAGIKPKRNGKWCAAGVRAILHNESYKGVTIAYKKSERIEIPNTTPAIITPEVWEAAQRQLKANRIESKRNMKRQYLLRGHIRCRECNHAFYGRTSTDHGRDITDRRYSCSGRLQHVAADCRNPSWQADRLESKVWSQVEDLIKHPETIIDELNKRQTSANSLAIYQDDLKTVERKLKALYTDQEKLLQLALKNFPEALVDAENKRINSARAELKDRKTELEAKIEASTNNAVDVTALNDFINRVQGKIEKADFDRKRLALEMLDITVWVDHGKAQITGTIGEDIVIEDTQP